MPTDTSVQPPRIITDRDVLRRFLLRDPIATAYQLGDLDDAYWDLCTWYGAGGEDLDAVLLLYTGLSLPVLITYGDAGAMKRIVDAFHGELPGRAMVHMQPDHLDGVDHYFASDGLRPMVRMGLKDSDFVSAEQAGVKPRVEHSVEELHARDIGEIIALYQYYPDNFFEPAQLATGFYYGARVDGRLVSVAGVHVVSRRTRVACLGNIVTHPEMRGQGLSTVCTSHLCSELIAAGTEVLALNVARQNKAAVRVYEKLGFGIHSTYLEGIVTTAFDPS